MSLNGHQRYYTFEKIKVPRPQDKAYYVEEGKHYYDTGCQTAFRESEAQTVPWTPPYRVLQCKTPEVLTLACLSFHNGLLVTKYDVEILHRLRKKREWEKYLARIYTPNNEKLGFKIINELEKNEWEFREKEIEEINELRMKLAQQKILEQRMIIQERMNYRLKRARERCEIEKRVKLPKITADCERALRRTHQKYKGPNKMQKSNIIDRFTHMSSTLYAPLAMFGKNPADGHEKLCIDPRPNAIGDIYNALWKGISTTPLPQMNEKHLKKHCCKKLELYYMPDEIISADQVEKYVKMNKKVIINKKISTDPLPCELGEKDEEEEEVSKNVVLLQSIIKGRAIQSMVLRQLKSHRDLVCELKSTIGLNPRDKQKKLRMRKDILMGIRDFNIAMQKKGKIIGLIEKLEGHTLSTMLDYTSKALIHLEDEKRAHLFALAAEKERWTREASEAGRRQQEEIRQRQHEEMYKQMLKMHEISSDVLMEHTIECQIKDTSKALASYWAGKNAKDWNEIVDVSQLEEFEKIEHISKLTNQFRMDSFEKNEIRQEIKAKTTLLREYAKKVIYDKKDELAEVQSSSNYSALSALQKICKDNDEDTEGDKFHNELLENTPQVGQVIAEEIDKTPQYEDPLLEQKLMKEVETKSKFDKNFEKQSEEEVEEENGNLEIHISGIYSSSEKKSEIKEVLTSNIYDIIDRDEVECINKFVNDPVSFDYNVESSETSQKKEGIVIAIEDAEKRKTTCVVEENRRYFKKMAQKLLEQIMFRANRIAAKVEELKKDTESIALNEGCADALMQAYKIVTKALLKFSENITEEDIRESVKPWLDAVLSEAEKSVLELFEILGRGKRAPDEGVKEAAEEEETVSEENLIYEVTGPSQEKIPLIPEAYTGEHIFKGKPYWCAKIKYTKEEKVEKLDQPEIVKPSQVNNTEKQLKRLSHTEIPYKRKQTYLPDESHIRKPLDLIKSRRRGYSWDKEQNEEKEQDVNVEQDDTGDSESNQIK